MSKVLGIFFFTVTLLLSFKLIYGARSPAALITSRDRLLHGDVVESEKGVELEHDDESCEGVKEPEECLMRRTLAAHVDYIYTQKHEP
ncbi:Phytosulfokines 3 [Quillaja saponaria]|uniref:Phytosulfokine n=1 Tax=Quillaja saponaria TaxID=32244 RepID=A0AAD7LJQ1_QUISA|nr:Phytosulfokines 3 [Quillaja saponaria]